jgi:methionyl-tRNA formyltransferase
MRITILSGSPNHPINTLLVEWININKDKHEIHLVHSKNRLSGGDLLLLISCSEIITSECRKKYETTLVIHASDLPKGKGWSPHIWQIIDGAAKLTITLLEAEDKVDSGDIWSQITVNIPNHALWDEINQCIFNAELELMDIAIKNFEYINPRPQSNQITSTYYSKRSPDDSELDPQLSILEQFNLMRICDPERFPAFFKLHGYKYKIILEKIADE